MGKATEFIGIQDSPLLYYNNIGYLWEKRNGMHHIDLMDSKITEKEMFRRSSCLSHSPNYQSLENMRVKFRQVFLPC